ncbi:hypothetical protein GCM10007304_11600 [Rhodococcoides trifolii]|uniref:Uncharacterized protein n=1 Tax=Rhodococcoides trifolii TaxID=908250 RepID=A0A917FRD7_9NOCA|nr:hypothetical protein GCM10007304_11600 [Rhodococcus trifolii]
MVLGTQVVVRDPDRLRKDFAVGNYLGDEATDCMVINNYHCACRSNRCLADSSVKWTFFLAQPFLINQFELELADSVLVLIGL